MKLVPVCILLVLVVAATTTTVDAWTIPPSHTPGKGLATTSITGTSTGSSRLMPFDWSNLSSVTVDSFVEQDWNTNARALLLGAVALSTPGLAEAASGSAVPSAMAAYGHYLSILVMTAAITAERLTVKPNMSIDEEKFMGAADITVGISGVAVLVSGYYRATQYGKGWDFYSHEPIFWVKMAFLGIFGGLSLFPTITIIQRLVKIQQEGAIEPMSEELAVRMTKVLNAELTALAFIPLAATLMARGVAYTNDFPTQVVGPAFFAVVTAGAVYKYVKDAITWKDPVV